MATTKQRKAARANIKKAQQKWKGMSHRQHALAQPQGRTRAKPGAKGGGEFYRVEVRPKEEFVTYRYHDVGKQGHLERLAGKRSSGSWDDQAWLISKKDAHVSGGKLVGVSSDAKRLLKIIGPAKHLKGDIFHGHPRKNVPEREKPTTAQRRAYTRNIVKAQKARWR